MKSSFDQSKLAECGEETYMIKVLVVDDSPVARELISHVLSSDPGIRVIGTAGSGRDAIESIKQQQARYCHHGHQHVGHGRF